MSGARLIQGDALAVLKTLPEETVRCCCTSPPYWGLRDYGVSGQIGLEPTPEEYVVRLVEVFREVRRVLTPDGTLWLNLGDSYTGSGKGGNPDEGKQATNKGSQSIGLLYRKTGETAREAALTNVSRRWTAKNGLAPKNLVGIPWLVAFALRADGWWLRSDIIWSKPNPMPESVTDRPTRAHEYVFLLSRSARYYYDQGATLEPVSPNTHARLSQDVMAQLGSHRANGGRKTNGPMRAVDRQPGVNPKALVGIVGREKQNPSFAEACSMPVSERNAHTVWEITTQAYKGAHFATFPEELARRCILAGSAPGDMVLDPFCGSGTTCAVAVGNGRAAIGIDLNPKYLELARQRIGPMLCEIA